MPPIELDDGRALLTWLVNPSGGLVGGDVVSCAVDLKDNAHVVVSSPSATRVYRSLSLPATQHVSLRLGQGSILEWMPELTIPFAGSRYVQRLEAKLAPGATLVIWDAMAAGRIARGERWAFDDYTNDVCVQVASGARLIDRAVARPGLWQGTSDVMGEWNYSASLYVIGDAIGEATWDRLDSSLRSCARAWEGQGVLAGVSRSAAPGIVVKVLARSCPALTRLYEGLWEAVRGMCWGRPRPDLRRY
ncbi:hypothetical protein YTPLAS18_39570 [Nitrospira sp.]|nr:hypothetical protein YTPLAS18_39570 [Nitrospira sp.]